MMLSGLLLMMSLLGSIMAVTFQQRDTPGVPLVPEEEGVGEEAVGCDMPPACNLKEYKEWYRLGSHCVKYFRQRLNFTDAEMTCRRVAPGGHLVSVHNSRNNNKLRCLVLRHNSCRPRIWMGGFELFQSGHFVWTDGSKWNYEAWVPGQPSQRWGNRENCVEMNWHTIGKWNDHGCSVRKSFVCAF